MRHQLGKFKTLTLTSCTIFALLIGSLVQASESPAKAAASSILNNSLSNVAIPLGDYGPDCAVSGSNQIYLIAGATSLANGPSRTYSLADLLSCVSYVPDELSPPIVTPSPLPSTTPTTTPTPFPLSPAI